MFNFYAIYVKTNKYYNDFPNKNLYKNQRLERLIIDNKFCQQHILEQTSMI